MVRLEIWTPHLSKFLQKHTYFGDIVDYFMADNYVDRSHRNNAAIKRAGQLNVVRVAPIMPNWNYMDSLSLKSCQIWN